jgi:hypothetical protein
MGARTLLMGALVALAAPASAANLVVNGDFETGVLTPWIDAFGNAYTTPLLPVVISGNYSAWLLTMPNDPIGSLRQFVTPLDGVTYQLDFSWGNYLGPARLRVTYGGADVLDRMIGEREVGSNSYRFVGDGVERTLDFAIFAQAGSVFVLDDVRILPADIPPGIPEPSSWALFIAGFGFVGAGLRQVRRAPAL